ncbi:hypothetical protein BSL78_25348 [Apostichopus japonicus]|uniref:LRRCT domain-containing protein n=1 Tax=Stichopus japonicus TaxID=307972 RepID=A0A2G8JQ61_STIJA|nr:hypothetical protein BSL78_25348 [Apostichopus japonicus]
MICINLVIVQASNNCPQFCNCGYAAVICDGDSGTVPSFPIQQSISWLGVLKVTNTDIPRLQTGQIVLPFCPYLYYLDLSDNQILTVAESLLETIHSLVSELAGNNLTIIPIELLQTLSYLETVVLNRNQIDSVPSSSFQNNRNLSDLYLFDNQIHTISPGAFIGLQHLASIDLNNNLLGRFALLELANYRKVYLDGNFLSELIVPSDCTFPSLLELVSLSSNRLKRLQNHSLCSLKNLQDLILSNNGIHQVDGFIFGNETHNLEYLNLANNELRQIPVELFKQLPKLHILTLFKNKISHIPANAFINNNELIAIHLVDNLIRWLDVSSLHGLNRLDFLDISRNNLTSLPDGILDSLSDFGIDLRYNPWYCDCELIFLNKWLTNTGYFTYEILCYDPIEYRGTDIMDWPSSHCASTTVLNTPVVLTTQTFAEHSHFQYFK